MDLRQEMLRFEGEMLRKRWMFDHHDEFRRVSRGRARRQLTSGAPHRASQDGLDRRPELPHAQSLAEAFWRSKTRLKTA